MQRLDIDDLGLDAREAADLLLLAAQPGVELAIEHGQLGDLVGGTVDRLPLLLQRRGLLGDVVGQRLDDGELVLDGGNRLGGLGQGIEGALDCLEPARGLFQPAGGGLVLLVDRFEP